MLLNASSSEVTFDTDDLFISNGTAITINWSPERILPIEGAREQYVDILLQTMNSTTLDSDSSLPRTRRDAPATVEPNVSLLASNVPNNGTFQIMVHVNGTFSELFIEIKITIKQSLFKRAVNKIIGFFRSGVRFLYRFIVVSARALIGIN